MQLRIDDQQGRSIENAGGTSCLAANEGTNPVLPIVRLDGDLSVSDVDVLVADRFRGFHPGDHVAEKVAVMPNSAPRKRFRPSILGNGLGGHIKWGLVALGLTISVAQAKAEYLVNVGDVLEVAAAGVPELRSRAAVQTDGNISLPLVGVLQVAGLSLPQIRAKVGAALANKVFRQRSPEGRESVIVIDADEITATVADYRPIYINGDVSKPGQYPYLPSITVRQLIALASGYDIMHVRMNNPYLDLADMRAEYGSLWTEFAKEQARSWRIKMELGEATQIAPSAAKEAPIARSAISEIFNAEAEYLKTKQSDYQQEKEFIQRGVRQGDEEVRVLSEQQKREEEGFQSDQEELQKAQDMFARGTLTSPRVTDARRAVLLSSTRKLQTSAQLLQVKKQQDDLVRRLTKLDDQRRLDLLRELQDASLRLNQVRERLQAVGEKIQYTAMVRSQLVRGSGSKPDITIFRKGKTGPEQIAANEDSELQPGDTVEVSLRYQDLPEVPSRKLSGLGPSPATGLAAVTEADPPSVGVR